jgi:hypothetical protein
MTRGIMALALVWVGVATANPDPVRMVVADMPYARAWAAALAGVHDYPIERIAEGEIMTGWQERPAKAGEEGFERVAERIHLQVEAFADHITRITTSAELRGWRDGGWVSLEDRGSLERNVLARIRTALR